MGLKHVKCQDCQTAGFFCFSSEVSDYKSRLKGGGIERPKHIACLT